MFDPSKLIEVDLKSMGDFEMDQQDGTIGNVPAQYRALDGKRVQLEGEMWSPEGSSDHVDSFILVYSITKWSIQPAMQVQRLVMSTVPHRNDVKYQPGEVRVVGILHVSIEREGERIKSLYKLDVESVEQK